VAGIYPAEPGFKSVVIAPNPGKLNFIKATLPHPEGDIKVDLIRKGKTGISGSVDLPDNLTGVFIWNENKIRLTGGRQKILFTQDP
jgi:alpha-L-rhamnosidase